MTSNYLRDRFGKLSSVVLWRAGGLTTAFTAAVVVARRMGPERLGYSSFALALATQASLIVTLSQDAHLVRSYKELESGCLKDRMIASVVIFRLLAIALCAVLAVVIVPFVFDGQQATLCFIGAFLTLASIGNPAQWIFQAKDIPGKTLEFHCIQQIIYLAGVLLLLRRSPPAGADLVISGGAAVITNMLAWRFAVGGSSPSLSITRDVLSRSFSLFWRGRWLFVSGSIIYVYTSLEQPLLAGLVNAKALGTYRAAWQVAACVGAITAVVPLMLYPHLIDWYREGADVLWSKQRKLAFRFLAIVAVACATLVPAVYWLFPTLYGSEFSAGALPCCLLIISRLVVLLNGIYCWGLWAMKRDKSMVLCFGLTATVSLISNVELIPRFGMIAAASVNVSSELVVLITSVLVSRYYVSRELRARPTSASTAAPLSETANNLRNLDMTAPGHLSRQSR